LRLGKIYIYVTRAVGRVLIKVDEKRISLSSEEKTSKESQVSGKHGFLPRCISIPSLPPLFLFPFLSSSPPLPLLFLGLASLFYHTNMTHVYT
jgi:hypothetical protein